MQTCTAVALDTAAHPSHPASAAYAIPAGLAGGRSPRPDQSPFPLARIDGGRPGPAAGQGAGPPGADQPIAASRKYCRGAFKIGCAVSRGFWQGMTSWLGP